MLHLKRENLAGALAHAERACELDPGSADAAFTLASTRAHMGQFQEAIAAYERALQIKPDWAEARTELLSLRRFASATGTTRPDRTRPALWPRQDTNFADAERLIRTFVLTDSRPPTPLLSRSTQVATLGSCFAANIARRLKQLGGVKVFFKPIGEDINNSYANRFLLDWIVDGVENEMSADFETIYGAEQRKAFAENFRRASLFIFTLGVAPVFFDRSTGAFVLAHGSQVEKNVLPKVCAFRTTTVAENVANLSHVIRRIRELSSEAEIVLTLSPVPLNGTYEMGSAVLADCLSKSVLRVTVDEVLRSGIAGLHYWPSYEIVRWLGPNLAAHHPPVYGADDGNTRHVSQWVIDLIIRLFIEYYGDESFQRAPEGDDTRPSASLLAGGGATLSAIGESLDTVPGIGVLL
jgi:hypothetical protein